MRLGVSAPRILDFDIENRPLSYLGPDYTTAEVTAIAAGWVGGERIRCWVLGFECLHYGCGEYHQGHSLEEMLEGFRKMYDQADMVTGHYIRGHDLPVLNGAMIEMGLPALEQKLTVDTKNDLHKMKYQSMSQENLAEMLGIRAPKVDMNQVRWREANRLTPAGLRLTRERVVGDVRQHREMYSRLVELGWLKGPSVWRPTSSAKGYRP